MSSYPPQYAYPSAPPLYRPMPEPPRMHWGWVLALDIVTRSFFNCVWLLVQANWVRKVNGESQAFVWALIHVCFLPFYLICAFAVGLLSGTMGDSAQPLVSAMLVIGPVAILILWIGTVFTLRRELGASPIEIPLGGVMTILFGPIYFQYHLRDFGKNASFSRGSLGLSSQDVPASSVGLPVSGQYLPENLQQPAIGHRDDS